MIKKQRIYAKPYDDINSPFTVDERGAFAEFIIQKPEEINEGLSLGATVLTFDLKREGKKFKPFWIAGRIVGLKAISPFNPDRESMLYQEDETTSPYVVLEQIPGGPHHHQPMVVKVALDYEMEIPKEFENDNIVSNYYISPIQRPPSSFSKMFVPEVRDSFEKGEPTLDKILNIKRDGLVLGAVGSGNVPFHRGENFLVYKWDVQDLENKHMFIVGESGSGKTVFLKNLAFELRNLKRSNGKFYNNRVIMLDVQGDIAQLLLPEIDKITLTPRISWQGDANELETRSFITSDYIHERLKPLRLIIPISESKNLSKNASALKILCEKKGIEVEEIGLRLQDLDKPSDVEYLMRISSQQAVLILDQFAEHFKSEQIPVTIEKLRNSITKVLNDPKNRGKATIKNKITGTEYLRSSFGAAQRALDALGKYFDYDIKSNTHSKNPLELFREEGTSIFYLADLNHEERIMWEMQILKWFNQNNDTLNEKLNKNGNEGETFVFFDEAHQIIPQRPMGIANKDVFDRLRSNFERLSREGRKFGINLILSTQSPKDLHEIVPDQCPNKVVMKINPRNAAYAHLSPELAMIASRFNYGQFWFQSPFNGTPNWLRIHSFATPIPHISVKKFFPKIRELSKKS
ncbi:MAG: ATP-binding protein [Bacteroidetes bacterium]|nr:MAG: ATP-binding protein [Bacteroidota bacterium]